MGEETAAPFAWGNRFFVRSCLDKVSTKTPLECEKKHVLGGIFIDIISEDVYAWNVWFCCYWCIDFCQ